MLETGLGSAVLAGFIIGEELPVRSAPPVRLCFLAEDSLLSWALLIVLLDVWWFWWEKWYLPLFCMNLSSTLYILEFLVADISLSWIMVDGYSSAGWTGLGSAVLAGFIIGEELPVRSTPPVRLCFLAQDSLLSWALLIVLLDVWWFRWGELYLPLFCMSLSSTLYILEFLVADISLTWIMVDGYSSAGRTGLWSAVLAGFLIGLGITWG